MERVAIVKAGLSATLRLKTAIDPFRLRSSVGTYKWFRRLGTGEHFFA